jgi:tetratricopeptide (TPR) repeat protein
MRKILLKILSGHGALLENWDGSVDAVQPIQEIISELITSRKYDGIDYAADDPRLKQENLFDNILLGLKREAANLPLMLVLDDLHWSDPTTLNLLLYLARNTREDRILFLGTYRPEDLAARRGENVHPLISVMESMSDESILNSIQLGRLQETRLLVENMLGDHNLGDEFMARVQSDTEGNPFFTIELIRLLQDNGNIALNEGGAWELKMPLDKIQIPTRMYDVIRFRLSRLQEEQQDILESGSVIGDEFESKMVSQILEINRMRLLRNLSDIEKTHKLIHTKGKLYRFDHAKIREVLYTDLPDDLRMGYHRTVAESIEALYPETLDELLTTMAHHYYEARDGRAVDYGIRAGQQALGQYANTEALRFFEMANEMVPKVDARKKELLRCLASTKFMIAEWDAALEHYQHLLELGESTGDDELKAEALYGICEVHEKKYKYPEALDSLEKSLLLFEEAGDELNVACCQRLIGRMHWRNGELDKAVKRMESGIAIAEKLGDNKLIGRLHDDLGNICGDLGDLDASKAHHMESIECLEAANDQIELVRSLNNFGVLFFRLHEYHESLSYMERSLEQAKKVNITRGMGYGSTNAALMLMKIGDPAGYPLAEDYSDKGMAIGKKIGEQFLIALTHQIYGMLRGARGNYDEAEEHFQKNLDFMNSAKVPYYEAQTHFEYGLMLKNKGDSDGARTKLEEARGIWARIGSKDRVEEAREALDQL